MKILLYKNSNIQKHFLLRKFKCLACFCNKGDQFEEEQTEFIVEIIDALYFFNDEHIANQVLFDSYDFLLERVHNKDDAYCSLWLIFDYVNTDTKKKYFWTTIARRLEINRSSIELFLIDFMFQHGFIHESKIYIERYGTMKQIEVFLKIYNKAIEDYDL